MTLTNLQRLRLNIHDPYLEFQDTELGDGSSIHFRLSSYPVLDASAQVYLNGILKTETTDYSLDDDTGKITFVSAPTNGMSIFVRGEASIFSDTELNDILAQHGSDVTQSTLHGLRLLMASRALMEKWSANGVSSDPQTIHNALKQLYDYYVTDDKTSAIDSGGMEEWAVSQGDYTSR